MNLYFLFKKTIFLILTLIGVFLLLHSTNCLASDGDWVDDDEDSDERGQEIGVQGLDHANGTRARFKMMPDE